MRQDDLYNYTFRKIQAKREMLKSKTVNKDNDSDCSEGMVTSSLSSKSIEENETESFDVNLQSENTNECKMNQISETFNIVEGDFHFLYKFIETKDVEILNQIEDIKKIHEIFNFDAELDIKLKTIGFLYNKGIINHIKISDKMEIDYEIIGESDQNTIFTQLITYKEFYLKSNNFLRSLHLNLPFLFIDVGNIKILITILKNIDRVVYFYYPFSSKDTNIILNSYLRDIKPYDKLPDYIQSLIISLKISQIFNFKLFLNIYTRIQYSIMSLEFIHIFMNGDISKLKGNEMKYLHLIKAKELFKLYKLTKDRKLINKALELLKSRKEASFRDARFKIFMYLEDYCSTMTETRSTINEFIALGLIKRNFAFKKLMTLIKIDSQEVNNKKILKSIKFPKDWEENKFRYFILASELASEWYLKHKILEDGLEVYPGNSNLILDVIRLLKLKDLNLSLEFIQQKRRDIQKFEEDKELHSLIIFEEYLILRKLGKDYMKFLYKTRKKYNIPLFIQEIKYFENKNLENEYYHLYLFKDILRRDCNKMKCCSECKDRFKFIREYTLKHPENGDYILLDFYVNEDIEIKKISDHFTPTEGFYWPRLYLINDFMEKLITGINLAIFDFVSSINKYTIRKNLVSK